MSGTENISDLRISRSKEKRDQKWQFSIHFFFIASLWKLNKHKAILFHVFCHRHSYWLRMTLVRLKYLWNCKKKCQTYCVFFVFWLISLSGYWWHKILIWLFKSKECWGDSWGPGLVCFKIKSDIWHSDRTEYFLTNPFLLKLFTLNIISLFDRWGWI